MLFNLFVPSHIIIILCSNHMLISYALLMTIPFLILRPSTTHRYYFYILPIHCNCNNNCSSSSLKILTSCSEQVAVAETIEIGVQTTSSPHLGIVNGAVEGAGRLLLVVVVVAVQVAVTVQLETGGTSKLRGCVHMMCHLFECLTIHLFLHHISFNSTNDFQPSSGDCEWNGSSRSGSCRTAPQDDRMSCSGRTTYKWCTNNFQPSSGDCEWRGGRCREADSGGDECTRR